MENHGAQQHDFHLKRVTQSQYRGGHSRLSGDLSDPFANRDIPPVEFKKNEDKVKLKSLLIERTDIILNNVLPKESIDGIKKSGYLDDIFKTLGI